MKVPDVPATRTSTDRLEVGRVRDQQGARRSARPGTPASRSVRLRQVGAGQPLLARARGRPSCAGSRRPRRPPGRGWRAPSRARSSVCGAMSASVDPLARVRAPPVTPSVADGVDLAVRAEHAEVDDGRAGVEVGEQQRRGVVEAGAGAGEPPLGPRGGAGGHPEGAAGAAVGAEARTARRRPDPRRASTRAPRRRSADSATTGRTRSSDLADRPALLDPPADGARPGRRPVPGRARRTRRARGPARGPGRRIAWSHQVAGRAAPAARWPGSRAGGQHAARAASSTSGRATQRPRGRAGGDRRRAARTAALIGGTFRVGRGEHQRRPAIARPCRSSSQGRSGSPARPGRRRSGRPRAARPGRPGRAALPGSRR